MTPRVSDGNSPKDSWNPMLYYCMPPQQQDALQFHQNIVPLMPFYGGGFQHHPPASYQKYDASNEERSHNKEIQEGSTSSCSYASPMQTEIKVNHHNSMECHLAQGKQPLFSSQSQKSISNRQQRLKGFVPYKRPNIS